MLAAAVCALALAALPAAAGELILTIVGADGPGVVMGRVFRDAPSFERRTDAAAQFVSAPDKGRVVVRVADLPPGRYAVATFLDRNGNAQIDTTLFGLPTEPYGFSNDASGVMGPPDFAQAAFEITGEPRALTIHLR